MFIAIPIQTSEEWEIVAGYQRTAIFVLERYTPETFSTVTLLSEKAAMENINGLEASMLTSSGKRFAL